MKNTKHNVASILRSLLIAVASLWLTACGGAGGGAPAVAPPAGLSYPSPQGLTVGVPASPLTPTVTGSPTNYSVSPQLPAGLALNPSSGVISGTPTAAAPQATYTVKASNTGGSTSFPLVLAVLSSVVAPEPQLVVANSPTTISATWLPAPTTDNVRPVVYRVYVSTAKDFQPSPANLAATVTDLTHSTITSLSPGTEYFVRVDATDRYGELATSQSTIAVTTPKLPLVTKSGVSVSLDSKLNLSNRVIGNNAVSYTLSGNSSIPAVGSYLVGDPALDSVNQSTFLYKVTATSVANGTLTISTAAASLEDLVQSGQINYAVTGSSVQQVGHSQSGYEYVRLRTRNGQRAHNAQSPSQDQGCSSDVVNLDVAPGASLTPIFNISASYQNGGLQSASITVGGTITGTISGELNLGADASISCTTSIDSIPVPNDVFFVGFVPVVIGGSIDIGLGIDINTTGPGVAYKFDSSLSVTPTVGLTFSNGTWSPQASFTHAGSASLEKEGDFLSSPWTETAKELLIITITPKIDEIGIGQLSLKAGPAESLSFDHTPEELAADIPVALTNGTAGLAVEASADLGAVGIFGKDYIAFSDDLLEPKIYPIIQTPTPKLELAAAGTAYKATAATTGGQIDAVDPSSINWIFVPKISFAATPADPSPNFPSVQFQVPAAYKSVDLAYSIKDTLGFTTFAPLVSDVATAARLGGSSSGSSSGGSSSSSSSGSSSSGSSSSSSSGSSSGGSSSSSSSSSGSSSSGGTPHAPSISGVTPSSIPSDNINHTLTVNGANFVSGATLTFHDPQNNAFASVSSKLTFVSSGQISYQFDDGSDPGIWTVQVTNPDGQSSAAATFTVSPVTAPSITGVSPSSIPADNNLHQLTISGNNFSTSGGDLRFIDPSNNVYNSTDHPERVVSVSATQWVYNINDAGTVGTWNVQVVNSGGQASNVAAFAVTGSAPAPSVSGVSPTSYPSDNNNHTLTVNGANFVSGATLTFHDPQNNAFASVSSKLTFINSGQISYQFNDGSDPGTWTVQVTNPDRQQSGTASFTVETAAPAPSISGVSPTSYPSDNNNHTLAVNGANFVRGATLTFHDPQNNAFASVSSKLTFVNSGQISYQFNDGSDPGAWTVQVTNPDGQSSAAASFTVTTAVPAPSISSVSPTSYPADGNNHTLTVNGANFVSGATLTFHDPQGNAFASTSSKLTFVNSGQITYAFNDGSDAGTWTVLVTNPDGQSSAAASFTVTAAAAAPSISGVSPSSIPADNNLHQLTISGSNFSTSGGDLRFTDPSNNVYNSTDHPDRVVSVSSTQWVYNINDASTPGTWQVQVVNSDGQTSSAASFTVTAAAAAPSISSVSPTSYPADGNNHTLTVNGANFVSGAALIFHDPQNNAFTSVASKLTFVNSGQISYQFNDGSDPGTWTVQVTNPDGQQSGAATFAVTAAVAAPSISGVSPSSIPADNNLHQLTISGSNFSTSGGDLRFTDPSNNVFNSTDHPERVVSVSSTQWVYNINDANTAGTWQVQVVNSDGQTSNSVSFAVTSAPPAPSISSVSPSSIPADNNNHSLAVNGANFVAGATLTFHDPQNNAFTSNSSKLTFVNSGQITYQINDGSDPGTWTVQVTNPDGQQSGTASFAVN